MTIPSLATRVASQSIAAYLRHVPVARGKTRLFQTAARYGLVAQVRNGLSCSERPDLPKPNINLYSASRKNPKTVTLLESLVTPNMVCVDVGANIGYFTGPLARAAQIVHAIEPTLDLVTRIRENAALNGLCNVVVHHAAVGEHIGSADLHISSEDPEANSLHGSGPTVRVPLTTLDALALPRVDLLKLDCEGSELAALRGAIKTINPDRPLILCEEIPGHSATLGTQCATSPMRCTPSAIRSTKSNNYVLMSGICSRARGSTVCRCSGSDSRSAGT